LRAEQVQQWLSDTTAAQNLSLDLERAEAEVARVDEQIAQLDIRAQVAGRFVAPQQADRLGSYVRQGELLGHVLAPQAVRVRVAVPEAAASLVRVKTQGTEVRLADAPGVAHAAVRQGETPAATHRLPSEALTDAAGGPYPVDPKQADGLSSLEPVVLLDLQMPVLASDTALLRVGGRAWARFDHGSEPLAVQMLRRSRQLFLRHVPASG
jgi:putative peptide zinc metalloprotease protein